MIEQSILSNLINNEQYFRKSIPFLKQDYFQDRSHKLAFKLIDEYVKKFKSIEPVDVVVEKIVYSMADGTKKEYSFAD